MNGQFHFGELNPMRYFLTIAVIIGMLFFFVGPDEDTTRGYFLGILQWQCQTVIPMFMAVGIHSFLSRMGSLGATNAWVKLLVSGLITAVLFSPLALLIDLVLTAEALTQTIPASVWREFTAIAPIIVSCWLAINLPFQLGYQLKRNELNLNTVSKPAAVQPLDQVDVLSEIKMKTPTLEPGTAQKCVQGFMALVQEPLSGEIIFLKSELHYLQVVTVHGSSLVLYSLKNAINELSHYDGFQPHRSFWVNRAHVRSIKKIGREGRLTLSTGHTIPVSRSQMKALKSDNLTP